MNIEIHGTKRNKDGFPSVIQTNLSSKITELFKRVNYKDEIVITIIESTVKDLKDQNRPFIRIFITIDEELFVDKTMNKLKSLMDIEVMPPIKFYSKSK